MAILQFIRSRDGFALIQADHSSGLEKLIAAGQLPPEELSFATDNPVSDTSADLLYDVSQFEEGRRIEESRNAKIAELLEAEGVAEAYRDAQIAETITSNAADSISPASDNVTSLAEFRARKMRYAG